MSHLCKMYVHTWHTFMWGQERSCEYSWFLLASPSPVTRMKMQKMIHSMSLLMRIQCKFWWGFNEDFDEEPVGRTCEEPQLLEGRDQRPPAAEALAQSSFIIIVLQTINMGMKKKGLRVLNHKTKYSCQSRGLGWGKNKIKYYQLLSQSLHSRLELWVSKSKSFAKTKWEEKYLPTVVSKSKVLWKQNERKSITNRCLKVFIADPPIFVNVHPLQCHVNQVLDNAIPNGT